MNKPTATPSPDFNHAIEVRVYGGIYGYFRSGRARALNKAFAKLNAEGRIVTQVIEERWTPDQHATAFVIWLITLFLYTFKPSFTIITFKP